MEDEKQLRQVLRMAHQLPEPDWNLFARVSKKYSKLRPEFHSLKTQQSLLQPKRKYEKKENETAQRREK
jgi:hypothetical protein